MKSPTNRAFTLLEVMVSIAVLAAIVVLIAQLMSGATSIAAKSGQRVDADSGARTVFDRMSDDFANMAARRDIDFVIKKNAGNDEAYFFADAPATTPASGVAQPLALVGYRIKDGKLQRLGKGLTWDKAPPDGPVFLTFPKESTEANPASTLMGSGFSSAIEGDENWHILGDGVFRLEFSFILKPTSEAPASISPGPFTNAPADTIDNADRSKGGLAGVQSIVVTLAVLDERSRLLPNGKPLADLAAELSDAGQENLSPSWRARAETLTPGQVRIYQRTFPINAAER